MDVPDHYQTTYVSKTKIVVFYSLYSVGYAMVSGGVRDKKLYWVKTVISLNIKRKLDLQWQNIISVTINRDGDDCDGDDYFNVKMCLLFLSPYICDHKVLRRHMHNYEKIYAWKNKKIPLFFVIYSAWRRWWILKVLTRVR